MERDEMERDEMERDDLFLETIDSIKNGETNNENNVTSISVKTQNEIPIVTPISVNTENKDTLVNIIHPVSTDYKLYKRRWLMLVLFVLCSMANGLQWLQYSIISDVIQRFYCVSKTLVQYSSIIYMVTYIISIYPAMWLLEIKGVRQNMIIGALGTMIGAWLKVLAIKLEDFYITLIGQTISGFAQVFILNLSARLAAVWFGPSELSTACSIGVLGTQLGIFVCFLQSTWIIHTSNESQVIISGLSKMCFYNAIFSTIIFILTRLFIEEMPTIPPSMAQANQRSANNNVQTNFKDSLYRLVQIDGFRLHMNLYGICVGSFYAISTHLNSSLLVHFPNNATDVGPIGILIVVAGMVGSVVCGFILDKTHKFKETALVLYACSVVGLIIHMITLSYKYIYAVYISAFLLGFFMTSYLSVGFELGTELTYPESEGTSSGLLNASVQFYGIFFTYVYEWIFNAFGDFLAIIFLTIALMVGTYFTALVPSELRRQTAQENNSSTN